MVSFAPGKYNALSDHREVWWDPDLVSARDDGVGAYVAVNDGIRTPVGQFDETLDVPVAKVTDGGTLLPTGLALDDPGR
ncbi:MAG: hypothetical protein R2789_13530 [Microthrixaceae bacterium]